jgi:20S proteasome alpha/beta subunit
LGDWGCPNPFIEFDFVVLTKCLEWKATAVGKNGPNAKKFLEKRYSENLELEDAINIALLTLKDGFEGIF